MSKTKMSSSLNSSNSVVSTDALKQIGNGVLALVLTVAGLTEVFPLWLNSLLYIGALSSLAYSIWRWEGTKDWKWSRKFGLLVMIALIYVVVVSVPLYEQYRRELTVKITFKDSPSFTWVRRQIITRDVSKFNEFLSDINIPTIKSPPPFGVFTGPGANQLGSSTPANLPLDRSTLVIGQNRVKDRTAATKVYGDYLIGILSRQAIANSSSVNDLGYIGIFGDGISSYLNHSFWSGKSQDVDFPPYTILWTIRGELGSDFSDRLAAALLETIATDRSIKDDDMNVYLVRGFIVADSVIDNECSRWPRVREILVKDGLGESINKAKDVTPQPLSIACTQEWKH